MDGCVAVHGHSALAEGIRLGKNGIGDSWTSLRQSSMVACDTNAGLGSLLAFTLADTPTITSWRPKGPLIELHCWA